MRACQAGVSLRLHEASETELPAALGAAGPLIGQAAVSMVIPSKAQGPPCQPPSLHRPYSVAESNDRQVNKTGAA